MPKILFKGQTCMDLNGGKTNVSLFFNYRDREGIAIRRSKMGNRSHRYNYLQGSLHASVWSKDTNLRNLYTTKRPIDMSGTAGFTDQKERLNLLFPVTLVAREVEQPIPWICMVPDFETRTQIPRGTSNVKRLQSDLELIRSYTKS